MAALPLPVAQASCACNDNPVGDPLDHWCGWPGPCCLALKGQPWRRAKNLNHLPICHEGCWKRDAVAVVREMVGMGMTVSAQGHLRLCHRRCYVNDFVRNQTWQLTGEVESPRTRKEVVPCNQTASELLGLPRLHHWLVRWFLRVTADSWQAEQEDRPWPAWLVWREADVLRMTTEEEREKGRARSDTESGTSGQR